MAGLLDDKACVAVGPPLSVVKAPSCGSTPLRSPAALKAQLVPLSRLVPFETIAIVPPQLLPVLALSRMPSAVSLMAAPAVFAAEPMKKQDMGMMKHDMDAFMKSCDMDHDGMVSKAEMMKHMEKMFDRMDTKKTGKLDKKQAEAFLKQFTASSGG